MTEADMRAGKLEGLRPQVGSITVLNNRIYLNNKEGRIIDIFEFGYAKFLKAFFNLTDEQVERVYL